MQIKTIQMELTIKSEVNNEYRVDIKNKYNIENSKRFCVLSYEKWSVCFFLFIHIWITKPQSASTNSPILIE